MPNDQFNIGKDIVLSIVGPTGPLSTLGLLVEFEPRPRTTTLQSLPINRNGIPVHRNTYQGWEGTFIYDRQNGNLDILQNILESGFYAGVPDVFFQITEIVNNPDGSVDNYAYTDCILALETGGRWTQNDKVQQRFRFECSQRVPIG